jgi:hypothetical protein
MADEAVPTKHPELSEVIKFLSGQSEPVQEIALKMRDMILKNIPGLIEQIDLPANMLAYGFARTYKDLVCVVMPYKNYVNLGFPRGAHLSDPNGQLTGSGKNARHIKISTISELENPALLDLLNESVGLTRKK